MDEDRLVSAVSLPMWFPPVKINGDNYIDAVYITDANVEERDPVAAPTRSGRSGRSARATSGAPASSRSTSTSSRAAADTNFFSMWNRIKKNNDDIAAGRQGEFGRTIKLQLIQAEVRGSLPVQFLARPHGRGRQPGRRDGARSGAATTASRSARRSPGRRLLSRRRRRPACSSPKTCGAFWAPAPPIIEPARNVGKQQGNTMHAHLTIRTEDVDRFVTDPNHEAAATGWIESPLLGGTVPVEPGEFNLLVQAGDPRKKEMRYRLFLKHADGTPCTFIGHKKIEDDKSQPELWDDTTILYTTLYRGHLAEGAETPARADRDRHHPDPLPRLPRAAHDVPFGGAGPGRRADALRNAVPRQADRRLWRILGTELDLH